MQQAPLLQRASVSLFGEVGSKNKQQKICKKIEYQVANYSVQHYEIAKRSGSAMYAFVHAGLVAGRVGYLINNQNLPIPLLGKEGVFESVPS